MDESLREISRIWIEIRRLQHTEIGPQWVWLTSPLTSTSWDGDARSTTAKTVIDLSAVFSVPAGVKAIYVDVLCNDSGSAGSDCYIILDATDTAFAGQVVSPYGLGNDVQKREARIVPCDANGDIYYQVVATGPGSTFDAWLRIRGYCR